MSDGLRGDEPNSSRKVDAFAPRKEWAESRVVGSPDPPPPYALVPVFTEIAWKQPIFAIREPHSDWLLVVEWPAEIAEAESTNESTNESPNERDDAAGRNDNEGRAEQGERPWRWGRRRRPRNTPGRILRVRDRTGERQTHAYLELVDCGIYWIEFHPDYERNGQVFVCYRTSVGGNGFDIVVSRFNVKHRGESVDDVGSVCDPGSEDEIIRWYSAGHDGAALAFGRDGMLYVAVGDGSSDSDNDLTAQDVTSLHGSILRIDVDHPAPFLGYSIPPDNPFRDLKGARGEIWSLGHRNPWRITVDEKTGHLWVGNNGQDVWEFAHLVRRGDNCGWSVYEGSHPFYLNRQRGPGQLAAPTVEHNHSEFRSLTGGVVYYGSRLPALEGAYVYGDYATGAIWGVHHDGERVVWHRELARSTLDIVGFAVGHREELLVVAHTGGIHRLVESPSDDAHLRFPRRLSETGLFDSVADHRPAAGVYPYSVNVPGWVDGAKAERLVALVGDGTVKENKEFQCGTFPEGSVLVQTLSLPPTDGSDSLGTRIESRLLTLQHGEWAGYSYLWNEAQDDAELVQAEGRDIMLPPGVATGANEDGAHRRWRIPSRQDCMSCHSRAAGFVLGFVGAQLDRSESYDGREMSQIGALVDRGLMDAPAPSRDGSPSLVDPYDDSADLEMRVRGYLHVNCAACHMEAGGGNARMQLNLATKQDAMQLIGAHPQHQAFGIEQPLLVAPGDPDRSVLFHRISSRGPGQMPPRGTHVIDRRAIDLIGRWIAKLPVERKFVKKWALDDLADDLPSLVQGRSHEEGRQAFQVLGCVQCHRLGVGRGGGAGPNLTGIAQKVGVGELLESILDPSKKVAPEFATVVVSTIDGKVLTGLVRQEDAHRIVIALNESDSLGEPVTILKDDIEQRTIASTSTMPTGLLDTLEKSQILDLLAYLLADGDPDNPVYAPP